MTTIRRAIFVLMLEICLCTKGEADNGENHTNTTPMPPSSTLQNEPGTSSMGLTKSTDVQGNQSRIDSESSVESSGENDRLITGSSRENEDDIKGVVFEETTKPLTTTPLTTPDGTGHNTHDITREESTLKGPTKPLTRPDNTGNNPQDTTTEESTLKGPTKRLTRPDNTGNNTEDTTREESTLTVVKIAAVVGGVCVVIIIANGLQLLVLLRVFGKRNERMPDVTKMSVPKIIVTKDSDERLELSAVELGLGADKAVESVSYINYNDSDVGTPKIEESYRTNAVTKEPDSKVDEPVTDSVTDANTKREAVNDTEVVPESIDLAQKNVGFGAADNDWPDPPNIDTKLVDFDLESDSRYTECTIQIDIARMETSNTNERGGDSVIGSEGNSMDPPIGVIQGLENECFKPTETAEDAIQITAL